jgi:Rrf2 family protein
MDRKETTVMTSQTAEYALRAVVWLASRPDRALTTQEISRATKVPAGYLSKVLQGLARAGLVVSNPGRGGGFLLARDAEQICVLDVVNAVDGIQRIRKCPLNLRSHGRVLCPLHKRLDEALAMVEEAFAKSTIAELIATPSTSTPLCNGQPHSKKRIYP